MVAELLGMHVSSYMGKIQALLFESLKVRMADYSPWRCVPEISPLYLSDPLRRSTGRITSPLR